MATQVRVRLAGEPPAHPVCPARGQRRLAGPRRTVDHHDQWWRTWRGTSCDQQLPAQRAAAQRGHVARDPFFTEQERAALALTEAATRLQDGAPGVTDEIWAAATAHFDEKQLSAIILNIAMTNFFNRINRTTREQAGKTW
jgi:alkylhydroperoxidase family enzyme